MKKAKTGCKRALKFGKTFQHMAGGEAPSGNIRMAKRQTCFGTKMVGSEPEYCRGNRYALPKRIDPSGNGPSPQGQRTSEQAETIFTEIGAEFDLARDPQTSSRAIQGEGNGKMGRCATF